MEDNAIARRFGPKGRDDNDEPKPNRAQRRAIQRQRLGQQRRAQKAFDRQTREQEKAVEEFARAKRRAGGAA